jgi:8-oxo-dGTP pyrophosphatase MutT (NUDIX family)/predicted ABC-type ATPase
VSPPQLRAGLHSAASHKSSENGKVHEISRALGARPHMRNGRGGRCYVWQCPEGEVRLTRRTNPAEPINLANQALARAGDDIETQVELVAEALGQPAEAADLKLDEKDPNLMTYTWREVQLNEFGAGDFVVGDVELVTGRGLTPKVYLARVPGLPADTFQTYEKLKERSPKSGMPAQPTRWSEQRSQLHQRLLDDVLDRPSKTSPRAIVMMGGPGSGKGTVLKSIDQRDPDMVHIDADEFKQGLPEYRRGIEAGAKAAATSVHEESGWLVDRAFDEAVADKKNILLDGTGKNVDGYTNRIQRMKDAGYDVWLFYVRTEPRVGLRRALSRAAGKGRYVPNWVLAGAYEKIPKNFAKLARLVDGYAAFDNSVDNQAAKKITSKVGGKVEVGDEDLFETLIAEQDGPVGHLLPGQYATSNPRRSREQRLSDADLLRTVEHALRRPEYDDDLDDLLDEDAPTRRENPAKGPQTGAGGLKIGKIDQYAPAAESEYFGYLQVLVMGNTLDWAEVAALVRYVFKRNGLADYFTAKVGKTWVNPIQIDTKGAHVMGTVPGPQRDLFRELFNLNEGSYAWNYGEYSFSPGATAPKYQDPYADYSGGAGGWVVPAKYVNYVKALIYSVAVRNGHEVTPATPEMKPQTTVQTATGTATVPAGTVEVVEHTDGTILVQGDTYPAKDTIKEYGFKWSGGKGYKFGIPNKVWYLPKSNTLSDQAKVDKMQEVSAALGVSTPTPEPEPAPAPVASGDTFDALIEYSQVYQRVTVSLRPSAGAYNALALTYQLTKPDEIELHFAPGDFAAMPKAFKTDADWASELWAMTDAAPDPGVYKWSPHGAYLYGVAGASKTAGKLYEVLEAFKDAMGANDSGKIEWKGQSGEWTTAAEVTEAGWTELGDNKGMSSAQVLRLLLLLKFDLGAQSIVVDDVEIGLDDDEDDTGGISVTTGFDNQHELFLSTALLDSLPVGAVVAGWEPTVDTVAPSITKVSGGWSQFRGITGGVVDQGEKFGPIYDAWQYADAMTKQYPDASWFYLGAAVVDHSRAALMNKTGLAKQAAKDKPKLGEPSEAPATLWFLSKLEVGSILANVEGGSPNFGVIVEDPSDPAVFSKYRVALWSTAKNDWVKVGGEVTKMPIFQLVEYNADKPWWLQPLTPKLTGGFFVVREGQGTVPGKPTIKKWINAATPALLQAVMDAGSVTVAEPEEVEEAWEIGSTVTLDNKFNVPNGYVLDGDGDVLLIDDQISGTGDGYLTTYTGTAKSSSTDFAKSPSSYSLTYSDTYPGYYLGKTVNFDMAPKLLTGSPNHLKLQNNTPIGRQALFDALIAAAAGVPMAEGASWGAEAPTTPMQIGTDINSKQEAQAIPEGSWLLLTNAAWALPKLARLEDGVARSYSGDLLPRDQTHFPWPAIYLGSEMPEVGAKFFTTALGKFKQGKSLDTLIFTLKYKAGQAGAPVAPAPAAALPATPGAPAWQMTHWSLPPHPAWNVGIETVAKSLNYVGPKPGGSTPGGIYATSNDSIKFLVKFQPSERALSEAFAAALYRAVGVWAPDVRVGKIAGAEWATISPWESDLSPNKSKLLNPDENLANWLAATFLVDAWLANWDVIGQSYDNLVFKQGVLTGVPDTNLTADHNMFDPWDEKLARIDVGGSLTYRAQGAKKPESEWTDDAWQTAVSMLAKSSKVKSVFGKIATGVGDAPRRRMGLRLYAIQALTSNNHWTKLLKSLGTVPQQSGYVPVEAQILKLQNRAASLWSKYQPDSGYNSMLPSATAAPAPAPTPAKAPTAEQLADQILGDVQLPGMPTVKTLAKLQDLTGEEDPWEQFAKLLEAGDVTVNSLKFAFGGSSPAWTGVMKSLVNEGLATKDGTQYGLAEPEPAPTPVAVPGAIDAELVPQLAVGSLLVDGSGSTWAVDAAGVLVGVDPDVMGFTIPLELPSLNEYGPWELDSAAVGPAAVPPKPKTTGELLGEAPAKSLIAMSGLTGDWGRIWVKRPEDGLWWSVSKLGTLSQSQGGQIDLDMISKIKTRKNENRDSWLLGEATSMSENGLKLWREYAIALTEAPAGVKLDVSDAAMVPVKQAPKTADGRKIAAGALVFAGDYVLLTQRGDDYSWGLPGGEVEAGEDAKEAAERESEEEIGGLPPTQDTGIRLVVDYDTVRYVTVVLRAAANAAQTWRPNVGSASHGVETAGFAWVPRDELSVQGGEVVWRPRLHPGLAIPSVGMDSVLGLWKEQASAWDKAASAMVAAASGAGDPQPIYDAVSYAPGKGAFGLSEEKFWAALAAIPQPNPSGYTFSGVKKDTAGQKYVEYRPRLPDGTRPRVRLDLNSVAVATEQASTEMQLAVRASHMGLPSGGKKKLSAKQSYIGTGGATNTGEPIWPADAMPKFELVVKLILGKSKVTRDDLFQAAVLEAIGLPLDQATLAAPEAVAAVAAAPEPVAAIPKGKGMLTTKQVEVVNSLYSASLAMLGESSKATGAGALDASWATEIKSKAAQALKILKGGGSQAQTEAKVAQWLRWIALARAAGLWPNIIDPGARVVYTGTHWVYDRQKKRITPNAETNKALKMLADKGLYDGPTSMPTSGTVSAENRKALKRAAYVWLKYQRNTGPQPPNSIDNTAQSSEMRQWATADYTSKKAQKTPSWAGEDWANVRGFPIEFRYKVPGGQASMSWSSLPFIGFNQSNFCLRANTAESWGFIMVPTVTMSGTKSYTSEYEVTYVDLGKPIEADIIVSNYPATGNEDTTGTIHKLTARQLNAYTLARPPYGPDWAHYNRHVGQVANPRRRNRGRGRFDESTVIQTVMFDRNDFDEAEATEWLMEHGYHSDAVDATQRYLRFRQYNPEDFYGDTFRTISLAEGVKAVIGVPRRDRRRAAN